MSNHLTGKEGAITLLEESTTHGVTDHEPQYKNLHQRSIRFQFSLQILPREGFSVKGEASMDKTSTSVPSRASRQPVPDIEQEYDDNSVAQMPRSALRHRSIQPHQQQPVSPQTPNTGPIVPLVVPTRRVTGWTRFWLWVLLVLGIAFLVDGIVWPALIDLDNHFTYGNDRIASFDLDNHHFLTQETHNTVRIVVTSADGQHTKVLTTVISGAGNYALVTLSEDGGNIDVTVNGAYVTELVPDTQGMYRWKEVQ